MSFAPLFISHGSPMLAIEDIPARDFLKNYGNKIGKPRAIVLASAHFGTARPAVVGDPKPAMIYDFGGFDPALHKMVYPAPGDPAVALHIAELLQTAGLGPTVVFERGYDHGAWVPLTLLYPDADVPVVQVSIQPKFGPAYHLALGRVLEKLRDDDILVIGSGSATHNLLEFGRYRDQPDIEPPAWVSAFDDWLRDKVEAGAVEDLVEYRARAPFSAENHPSEEHLLPLHVALGAAGEGAKGRAVHSSYRHGVLSMASYAFQ